MMINLRSIFKIRPGEERMVLLVTAIALVTFMGSAIGSPGVEGLFLTRFGVRFLPYMYIALGVVTMVTSLVITALLGQFARLRLYVRIPLILALVLFGERILLILDLNWFYPFLWLGMNIMWTLQALFTWGIAGVVCDTRQAKRLFPLFGAGGILGIALGGLVTQPLVSVIGAENLLLIWAISLLVAYLLIRELANEHLDAERHNRPIVRKATQRLGALLIDDMGQGFRFVRSSGLMTWLSFVAILLGVLFFSLTFPFSKAVTTRFPNENDLSGFLGVFQGLSTGVAFLASLLLANRLYARFGITNMVLAYTGVYLVGFLTLTISAGFFSLVAFRFFQIFWFQGITNSAYQAIFNVVPAERRDQTRTFIDGVPGQIGIVLAGVILIFSERFLPPQGLFMIGGIGAALTTYFAWRARREYRGALVEALRAGHPHVFGDDEEPFGGFQRDAAAISTVIGGISHPDPVVRRVSAEILGNLAVPDAQDALVKALEDEDAQVRAALLRSLARAGAVTAMLEVVSCIHDSDPVVRQEAVMALRSLTPYNRGVESILEPLLQDPDSAVRAATAVTLLGFGSHMEAEATLRKMATADQIETRAAALSAIAIWGIADAYDLAEAGLEDPSPAVRRAAATALVEIDADRCIIPLVAALADEDPTVRDAIAKVLGGIGDRALPETLKALEDPAKEEGALFALDQFPTHKNQAPIRLYAQERIKQATYYHQVKLEMDSWTVNERSHLLRHSLQKKSMDLARQALRAVALLGNRRSISLAIDGLNQSDPAQRANALEILEAIDEAALVRPLLGLWEAGQESASATDERYLDLLRDTDPWIRACAVLVCGTLEDPEIIDTLNQLAQRDPDEMVRAVANSVMKGKEFMETLQTLSLMERILFLHRVPLFEELDPADLKRVASIARENLYPSGEYIVRQGDTGDEMYIIVSGEVRVLVHSAEGSPVEVARRKSGEYVGEMAILSHEPRMASLVADGQVRALCLGQKEFEAILRERPGTSIALIQILCARIREQGVGEKI